MPRKYYKKTDSEIVLKNNIIEELKRIQKTIDKNNLYLKLDDKFIRGFIMGAEWTTGLEVPSHWIEKIIAEVKQ